MSAHDSQVGGDHYRSMKIQPVEFIHANGIPYLEGNVIKYLVRHKAKNGKQDLEKAIHYIQMIIEREYGEGWRMLAVGEVAGRGDEALIGGKWEPIVGMIGFTIKQRDVGEFRRPIGKATK